MHGLRGAHPVGVDYRESEEPMTPERLQKLLDREANIRSVDRGLIGSCDICWTNAWVPVETEAECALTHPHKADLQICVRCDHCWLVEHWKQLQAKNTELQADKDKWFTFGLSVLRQLEYRCDPGELKEKGAEKVIQELQAELAKERERVAELEQRNHIAKLTSESLAKKVVAERKRLASMRKLAGELVEALETQRRGDRRLVRGYSVRVIGQCFCNVLRHSADCKNAQAALAKAKKKGVGDG